MQWWKSGNKKVVYLQNTRLYFLFSWLVFHSWQHVSQNIKKEANLYSYKSTSFNAFIDQLIKLLCKRIYLINTLT